MAIANTDELSQTLVAELGMAKTIAQAEMLERIICSAPIIGDFGRLARAWRSMARRTGYANGQNVLHAIEQKRQQEMRRRDREQLRREDSFR